jgi:hypothetical protein
VVAHAQQSGAGKLVKVAVGGKLHRRVVLLFCFVWFGFSPFDETTELLLRHHLQDWRLRD